MAIIRIKRTTSSSLPTGLTFGELAFVGASGGATANRLYIAGPEGTCIWIGAQILNQPTYWSGVTAQTTLASIAAIEDRMVAGGAITFSSDLSVNISANKYFGKYTRGDTIPATGKTVKEVVEMALSESISPTVAVSAVTPTSSVLYGQTAGSLTVPVTYTILTAGASAAGSTLEFRYGTGTWAVLSTTLKDDTKGTNQQYSANYTHNWNRLTNSNGPGTGFDTQNFNYRYSVHDTAGASATSSITPYIVGAFTDIPFSSNPSSFYSGGITAASLRTGSLGAPSGTETNTYREKGNTFTTVNFTLQRQNIYIPLSSYVLQAAEWVNGSYGAWNTIKTETISGNPTSITRGLTYSPTATGASLDRLKFRVRVNDSYYDGAASAPGTTKDIESSEIFFDYMVFFGATTNTPTTSADIRGLSSGIVAGSGSGAGGGAGSGAGAIANPFSGLRADNNTKFIVALPDSVTATDIIDSATNFNVGPAGSGAFALSGSLLQVEDRSGSLKNYNVYIMSISTPYGDSRTHSVTRTGSVSQP
jgi:hypothetical protein